MKKKDKYFAISNRAPINAVLLSLKHLKGYYVKSVSVTESDRHDFRENELLVRIHLTP